MDEPFARRAQIAFRDQGLLRRALTHRSFVNEHSEALEDNERLEYLGDAALDFLIAAWLYKRFPEMDEGGLTRLRSALVRTEQLAEFAREIDLGEAILLGRGEEATGGRQRPALLCAGFEALVGALFLDGGLEALREFMEPRLDRAAAASSRQSQLWLTRAVSCRSERKPTAARRHAIRTVQASGPDHAREFVVEVSIDGQIVGRGQGRSKQDAAQQAAADALLPPASARPFLLRPGRPAVTNAVVRLKSLDLQGYKTFATRGFFVFAPR